MARPEIRAVVVYSPAPREVHEWPLVLAPGSTVLGALLACGLNEAFPDLDLRSAAAGVWGRKAGLEQALRDGDRVEVYRPLKVDPKLARRERFRQQGVRSAGLFARRT
ncbi:MAG TPA: RnfH family protein [Ramlibacter sp.]|jgi:putative ubiquitin-RnfH superfamily antitoxin RatB of RatAB toxin-antitoxin module